MHISRSVHLFREENKYRLLSVDANEDCYLKTTLPDSFPVCKDINPHMGNYFRYHTGAAVKGVHGYLRMKYMKKW